MKTFLADINDILPGVSLTTNYRPDTILKKIRRYGRKNKNVLGGIAGVGGIAGATTIGTNKLLGESVGKPENPSIVSPDELGKIKFPQQVQATE